MSVAFVQRTYVSTASSLNFAAASVSGHLLIVVASYSGSGTLTPPAGWTQIFFVSNNVSSIYEHQCAWWKISAGEQTLSGFTFSGGPGSGYWAALEYSGTDTTSPIDGVSTGAFASGTTTATCPSSTPSQPQEMAIALYGANISSDAGWTPPSGWTERVDGSDQANGSHTVGVSELARGTSTSATGTVTAVYGGSVAGTSIIGSQFHIKRANSAPTCGSVTAPAAGATVDASTTITWNAGSDPDGDAIVYDLDYSTDNGSSWTGITTGVSATSYAWTTSAIASSTACLVRVRARDALGATSAYSQSGLFTISHNSPPNAPTNLNPSGSTTIDCTAAQIFSWTFSDPNAGDTQSKFDLQYRVGTGAWTTVTQTTTSPSCTFAANTFTSGSSYEWQVRTYDSQGAVSAWSSSAFFTAATPPATPGITSPANGSTIGTQSGTVAWSAPSQADYQVRKVADNAGAADTTTIYYDSGDVVSSTARNAALSYPVNNRYEHLQVRIKNAGLWSSWADVRVYVSYTPPATPTLTATADPLNGRIVITFSDPAPTGSQPTVSSHDVYVRTAASSAVTDPGRPYSATGIRIAAAVGGTSWTDYLPGSLIAYEYQLVANGSNNTSTPSAWTS